MGARSVPRLHTFTPAALTATRVGTWEYDVFGDCLRCDATMAPLYGLTADEGEAGVSMMRIRAAIDPEDLPRGMAKYERVVECGGLFVVEYRTHPRPGETRWVLVRGSYEADSRGRMAFGRGIAVDMTESKQDGYLEGRARFVSGTWVEPNPLDTLADLAVKVRETVDHLGAGGQADLRPLADILLLRIGRQIAAQLDGGEAGTAEQGDVVRRQH